MFYSQSQQLESHLPEIDEHWQGCQKGFFDTPHGSYFTPTTFQKGQRSAWCWLMAVLSLLINTENCCGSLRKTT